MSRVQLEGFTATQNARRKTPSPARTQRRPETSRAPQLLHTATPPPAPQTRLRTTRPPSAATTRPPTKTQRPPVAKWLYTLVGWPKKSSDELSLADENANGVLELSVPLQKCETADKPVFEKLSDGGGWEPCVPEECPDLLPTAKDGVVTAKYDRASDTLQSLDGRRRLHVKWDGILRPSLYSDKPQTETTIKKKEDGYFETETIGGLTPRFKEFSGPETRMVTQYGTWCHLQESDFQERFNRTRAPCGQCDQGLPFYR